MLSVRSFLVAALLSSTAMAWPANMTTSTVTETKTDTITNCPQTVTNCPAHSTITTVWTTQYTTVCPITQTKPAPGPTNTPPMPSHSMPGGSPPPMSHPTAPGSVAPPPASSMAPPPMSHPTAPGSVAPPPASSMAPPPMSMPSQPAGSSPAQSQPTECASYVSQISDGQAQGPTGACTVAPTSVPATSAPVSSQPAVSTLTASSAMSSGTGAMTMTSSTPSTTSIMVGAATNIQAPGAAFALVLAIAAML